MAKTLEELQVLISTNADSFQRQMTGVIRQLNALENTSKGLESKIPKSFGSVGTAAVAMGGLISGVVTSAFRTLSASAGSAIERLDTLQNFPRVMSNLGIGARESQNAISLISDKLIGLPTTVDAAAMAVQRFTSANKNIRASTGMFLSLNNAILAGGAPMDLQRTALEQLSQAYTKGKPDMMEWRAAISAMPAQMQQVAQAMNFTNSDALGEALRNGEVSMNKFMTTIMQLNKEGLPGLQSFEAQARNSTGGVGTAIQNLRTAVVRAMADIMNAIGQTNISSFINGIAKMVSAAVPYIVAFTKVVLWAISAVSALFGGKTSTVTTGANSTADALDGAASAAGGVADGAGEAGKNLGGAAKKAKELKGVLASFDEMNVLQEKPDSSDGGGGGGSGGGAGGGLGDMSAMTEGWDKSSNAIADKAEELFRKLKKMFTDFMSGFDLKKITSSFARLWDDIKKGASPVFKVITDVWQSYLKPFLYWAGNQLLPAFLNTLGGAINFVGNIIGSTWTYLKPFINAFLVPIAQFTGGVIVVVLNAIGDSLRWIASNQTAVDVLGGIAATILVVASAWQAYQLVAGLIAGVQLAINGALIAGTTASGAYAIGLGIVTLAQNAMATASTLLQGALSLLNPAMLAVAAAVTATIVMFEAFKLAQMQSKLASEQLITVEELEKKTTEANSDAKKRSTELIIELNDAKLGLTNASLALMNAEDQEAKAQEKLNGFIQAGDTSSREYRRAKLELEQAQQRVKKAAEEEKVSLDKVNDVKNQADNMTWKYIMSQKQGELAALAQAGKYDEVTKALQKMEKNTDSYKDSSGNMVKLSKEDAANMSKFIGDNLSKAETGYRKYWDSTKETTSKSIRATENVKPQFEAAGRSFGDGLTSGIDGKRQQAYNAGFNLGKAAVQGEKDATKTRSPSRVMKENGGFFSEGLAIGIAEKTGKVVSAAKALANSATSIFEGFGAEMSDYDITPNVGGFAIKKPNLGNMGLNIDTEQTPVHVVVKIGEEKLIDRVVAGINDESFMSGQSVIEI